MNSFKITDKDEIDNFSFYQAIMEQAIKSYERIDWSKPLTYKDKKMGIECGFIVNKVKEFDENEGFLPNVYFVDKAKNYDGFEEAYEFHFSLRDEAMNNGFRFLSSKDFPEYKYAQLVDLHLYLDTLENRDRIRKALFEIENSNIYSEVASFFISSHEKDLVDYYQVEKEAYEQREKERERQEEAGVYNTIAQRDDEEEYSKDTDMDNDYSDDINGGIIDDYDFDFG